MSTYKVPSTELRNAYKRTLKAANFCGTSSFYCGPGYNCDTYVLCKDCPLNQTDCEENHDAQYWRQWWKDLTGEEDNDVDLLKKVDTDNIVKMASKEEAKEIFDSHLKECDNVVSPKFKVVYTCLNNSYSSTLETSNISLVLEAIQFWYKQAIKWNSIANGDVSNIPNDFKDIYLKVFDSANNIIMFDEYTLSSKGLKKVNWVRKIKDEGKTKIN